MGVSFGAKIQGPGVADQLLNTQVAFAPAGSAQADAALITTKSPAIVAVLGADATKGVKLPKAVAGKVYFIKNEDASNAILKVYPNEATAIINALGAGAAISMAAKTAALFMCVAGNSGGAPRWVTMPLVPS